MRLRIQLLFNPQSSVRSPWSFQLNVPNSLKVFQKKYLLSLLVTLFSFLALPNLISLRCHIMRKCGHVSPPGEGTDRTRPLLQTTDFACSCQQWTHSEELALECYSWAAPGGQSPPRIMGYCMGCGPPWVPPPQGGLSLSAQIGGGGSPLHKVPEKERNCLLPGSAHMEGTANTVSHTLAAVRPFPSTHTHPPLPVQFAMMGQ